MTPTKPYLLRAIYEWICDNDCTPHVAVDARHPRASLPREYAVDGLIVLDISSEATQELLIDNEALTGRARFGAVVYDLYVPMGAILAIYAQETQHGMNFPPEDANYEEETELTNADDSGSARAPASTTHSRFQIIKGGKE